MVVIAYQHFGFTFKVQVIQDSWITYLEAPVSNYSHTLCNIVEDLGLRQQDNQVPATGRGCISRNEGLMA